MATLIEHTNITNCVNGVYLTGANGLKYNVSLNCVSISHSGHSILSARNTNIKLQLNHLTLFSNNIGIVCHGDTNFLTLTHSIIQEILRDTINLKLNGNNTFNVSHNVFLSNKGYLMFKLQRQASLVFVNNTVSNQMAQQNRIMQVTFSNGCKGSVHNNTFVNTSGDTVLKLSGSPTFLKLTENSFLNNDFKLGPASLQGLFNHDSQNGNTIQMAFNYYKENTGRSVMLLAFDHERLYHGENIISIISDYFVNCLADSVIEIGTPFLQIHDTVFHNFANSFYDLKLTYTKNVTLNCTNNWWGTTNVTQIKSRIQDLHSTNKEPRVLFTPFLMSPDVGCPAKNECSGRGTCVRPNYCECEPGWTGNDCSTVSCKQANNCHNRGKCVSPNRCQCSAGWLPPNCQDLLQAVLGLISILGLSL